MKPLSAYFHETNKVYEFRIKMAHVEPKGELLDRIKNALNAFCVESVSPVKRLPITEHWEFSKEGACECYVIDIAVRYPSIPGMLRQLIGERAGVNADWVCVKTMDEALNEELNYEQADTNAARTGALLNDPDLGAMPTAEAQKYVGQGRLTGLIKELSANTRKFEIEGTDNEYASGKFSTDTPEKNNSAVGSKGQK